MGVGVSSPHVVSAVPSSSGAGLLTLFPCSSVGSLPQETVLHELPCPGFSWDRVVLGSCGKVLVAGGLQGWLLEKLLEASPVSDTANTSRL